MHPRLRLTLLSIAAAVAAIWLGSKIAEEAFFWPALAAAATVAAVLVRLLRLPLDVIVTGWLIIGYVVGNRGFAQLMPAPGVPLLPAEAGLLLAGSWRLIRGAFARRLPFVPDALNWAVLVWLVAGGARLLFDIAPYRFTAIRDSATVYYALFFFIAQDMARESRNAQYLLGCVVVACLLVIPGYALFELYPPLFLSHLTVHGVPLILYKGDLVHTYFAFGSVVMFYCLGRTWRHWGWLVAGGLLLVVAGGDSRAALAGLTVALLILLLGRRWQFAAWQGSVAVLAFLVVLSLATLLDSVWAERKLNAVSDRLISITDTQGLRSYSSEDNLYKGDNNRFRLIWWRNVVIETWEANPLFGLGFGHDLARGFIQEYSPDITDDFTARSPHNIFLTVFGRMGGVGLLVWLAVCVCLARRGWRAVRHQEDPAGWALWCTLAVLLTSATFGVVLEGPMGAVPFWIIAGVAAARQRENERAAEAAAEIAPEPVADSAPGEKASAASEPAPAITG